jgi:hypothetical protein
MIKSQGKIKMASTFNLGKGDNTVVKTKELGTVVTDGTKVRCGVDVKLSKNYQSVGISCQVEYPTTAAAAEKAAKKAWLFVEEQLGEQMEEANKLLDKLS